MLALEGTGQGSLAHRYRCPEPWQLEHANKEASAARAHVDRLKRHVEQWSEYARKAEELEAMLTAADSLREKK